MYFPRSNRKLICYRVLQYVVLVLLQVAALSCRKQNSFIKHYIKGSREKPAENLKKAFKKSHAEYMVKLDADVFEGELDNIKDISKIDGNILMVAISRASNSLNLSSSKYRKLYAVISRINRDYGGLDSALQEGVYPNIRDRHGNTPLTLAIKKKDDKVIGTLLDCALINKTMTDKKDRMPLYYAISKRISNETVDMLIDRLRVEDCYTTIQDKHSFAKSPFYYAARKRNAHILQKLIRKVSPLQRPSGEELSPQDAVAMKELSNALLAKTPQNCSVLTTTVISRNRIKRGSRKGVKTLLATMSTLQEVCDEDSYNKINSRVKSEVEFFYNGKLLSKRLYKKLLTGLDSDSKEANDRLTRLTIASYA